MTEVSPSRKPEPASEDDVVRQLAVLRERMDTVQLAFGLDRPAALSQRTANLIATQDQTDVEPPPEEVTTAPSYVQVEHIEPAPGVDPNDPVLALGVADPDDLNAWLTDEVAVVAPAATDNVNPITAEMDAITKPSVYHTLESDDNDRMWRSVAPRSNDDEGDEPSVRIMDSELESRRWLTLLVVALVLVGFGIALALWLSAQPDTSIESLGFLLTF